MINSNEISVIMQGPVYGKKTDNEQDKITKICCKRVKELLPDCELILSTWEGTESDDIPFDVIIYNQDPGGIPMILNGINRMNNTNRMLVSTINGIKRAKKKYVLKLRTDMYLESLDFVDKFRLFPVNRENSIVKERIISLSANNPRRGAKIVFSISDWFEFGYRDDILKLWDISLQTIDKIVVKNGKADWADNQVAESYIWPAFLKNDSRYTDYLSKYDGAIPVDDDSIDMYEKSLAENVVLYEGKQLGLNSLKYWNKNYVRRDFARASCYLHYEWEQLYSKYCDKTFVPSHDFKGHWSVFAYIFVFNFLQKKFNRIYQILKKIIIK